MSKFADKIRDMLTVHEAYQTVFSSPQGQRVLRHILQNNFVMSPAHVAGDPHTSAMREGQRICAMQILRHFTRDHGEIQRQLTKMMEERDERT
jgi:hypothetical protein